MENYKNDKNGRLKKILNQLAELYPYGALTLSTDPVAFLEKVVKEIKDLRKAKK